MVSPLLTSLAAATLVGMASASAISAAPTTATSSAGVPAATGLTIQMPIDHFSSDPTSKTFADRYWVNGTYYKPGGPVFYYDSGEQTVTADAVQNILMEAVGPSSVMQLAAKYGGMGVMLEHRFYGASDPYPIGAQTGLANAGSQAYQYLTVEQALEDVVYLAENFAPPGFDASQLKPTQVPWIFLGGSYPGARAAWIRIRNPDIIYASWASSAPVQTTVDMAVYYEQVYQDMTVNCSSDMAAASQYVTDTVTSGTDSARQVVKILSYLTQSPTDVQELAGKTDSQIVQAFQSIDFTDLDIANTISNFVDDGLQSYGFSVDLLPWCDLIESFDINTVDTTSLSKLIQTVFNNNDNAPDKSAGVAATVNNAQLGDEASFLAFMYGLYQRAVAELQAGNSGEVNPYAEGDARSWDYQTCTELGYFQVSNTSSPDNLLSALINVTSWEQTYCTDAFPFSLPAMPNTIALDAKYGGWNMNPSQVMFTDGAKDPWHTLSTQSTSVDIGAPNRQTVQTVPGCGSSPANNDVFGLIYPDSYHASDLLGGEDSMQQGLALFEKALDTWLPCFQKHSITSNTTSGATPAATSTPAGTGTGTGTGTATSSASTPSKTNGAAEIAGSRSAQLGGLVAILAALILL